MSFIWNLSSDRLFISDKLILLFREEYISQLVIVTGIASNEALIIRRACTSARVVGWSLSDCDLLSERRAECQEGNVKRFEKDSFYFPSVGRDLIKCSAARGMNEPISTMVGNFGKWIEPGCVAIRRTFCFLRKVPPPPSLLVTFWRACNFGYLASGPRRTEAQVQKPKGTNLASTRKNFQFPSFSQLTLAIFFLFHFCLALPSKLEFSTRV